MRRSVVLTLSPRLVFPAINININDLHFKEIYRFTDIYGCKVCIFTAINANNLKDFAAVNLKITDVKGN
jgi:hypothetical protein